jgi:hypothetical protein
MAIECPKCGLFNPDTAVQCDCGYQFGVRQQAETAGPSEVDVLEERVATLTTRLAEAKDVVQGWVDTGGNLSRNAAEARAKNQGAGRGIGGVLLGSKLRASMRRAAAASNAQIAKEVADKRSRIADGKREAQAVVKQLQQELLAAKSELKAATARARRGRDDGVTLADQTTSSLDLLHKLKDAKDAGLLSEAEFEEKRRKLVSKI